MLASMFAGCSLIEHNYEKDARQVVAVIDPIEDKDVSTNITFKSGTKYIYKSELSSAMNTYGSSYMSNYGLTAEQAADRLLSELVTRELLIIEAERLLEQEKIEWTKADDNTYKKTIYNAIDSSIKSLKNNVLSDFGEIVSDATSGDATGGNTSTTYPVPDAETTEDDYTDYEFDANGNIIYEEKQKQERNPETGERLYNEDGTPKMVTVTEEVKDGNGNVIMQEDGTPLTRPVQVPKLKDWKPEIYNYPGMFGSEKEKSRDREAVRRFIEQIKKLPESDFRVTDSDRKKFDEDIKKIENVINEQGIEYVYPMLGETYLMEYFAGKSARESILISKLQNYIVGNVDVTEEDIADAYIKQLTYQTETYGPSREAYQNALSEDSNSVIYMRDNSCFFVKHILLPFSEEQKTNITAWAAKPENAGKDVAAYRKNMVNAITVYEHVNGEDDLSRPMTVKQVFDIVKSEMSSLKASPRDAERKFDELTYKYNTDPGAFGTGTTYMVKRDDPEGHSGYVEEFYDAAMKLYNDGYSVGEVLPEYAITEFGVHIMYLARKVTPGYRELSDYLTPGEYKTVRETFEEKLRTTKENTAFESWQNERINYYRDQKNWVHTYKDRYESLYKD